MFYRTDLTDVSNLRKEVDEYIRYYNNNRISLILKVVLSH
ncbi:IS3 family transposase [Pantoea stewartii]